MDPTRTQRYGKHYYRNNYVPSNSRQVLEDGLHPHGISTSSNSSWTFSNSHDIPKHKKGKLCGIFLMGAVMIVALAVIAIGGLAFYIGGHSTNNEHNVRKYETKENIGAKRQYSNRETETTKTTNNSSNIVPTTQSLLEISTAELNQTKFVSSGAILGISDTMKLLNDEVKNKKKEEMTTAMEMNTEDLETFTEITYNTEQSSVPILTTKNIEILPKSSEKPLFDEKNFSEGKKIVSVANSSIKAEETQNEYVQPTYSEQQLSPIVTTISVGLFTPHYAEEPWRPIIPSYRESIRVEHPYEQYSEKVFQHRYWPSQEYIIDNSPITFSKKSYEQNLGISSEFKGIGNKFKKPQGSQISDEIAVKYKDLITKQGLKASGEVPEVIIRSGDIKTSSPLRKSADVLILSELSTASTLPSYNTKEPFKVKDVSLEEEHTLKVTHNVRHFNETEESSEASTETTTSEIKITPTPATFKTILRVTSKKPNQRNFTAVNNMLNTLEALPAKNTNVNNEAEIEPIAWTETAAAGGLKTTLRSDILTSSEVSFNSTKDVVFTTPTINFQHNKIIKNPFADDSRSSSSSFNFGIPDLPILKQFQNLDTLLKAFGNTSDEKNTTGMSKYLVRYNEDADKVITRFPVRTKPTTAKSYKKDDFSQVEISTTETTLKTNPMYRKPVVIRGEVEVISGSLKQDTRATTEIPKLITLLPVRSNVNMMMPLRPRPKSNINSTITITDRRKPKMTSAFSTKESAIHQTEIPKIHYSLPFQEKPMKSVSRWVYHSSFKPRDMPEKNEKLFIVTPEPLGRNPQSNISTEKIFSNFPENLTGLPLYNTIEALLNVDNRDRGASRNNASAFTKRRKNLKGSLKKNTSEIVNQIVKVVDNVVISSGDLPKIIVKVNQTMVNKTTEDIHDKNVSRGISAVGESTKLFSSNYKLNQAGVPILTKILHKVSPKEEGVKDANETFKVVKPFEDCRNDSIVCGNGVCLSPLKKCNKFIDCKDGSDEKNCSCAEHLVAKKLHRKLCDGIVDCWDFSDEFNCEWCKEEFICSHSRMCIKKSQICDGKNDCPYGDDERNCVTVSPNKIEADTLNYHHNGFLMVRKNGKWGKLCIDNFDSITLKAKTGWKISDLGRSVCRALTFKDFDKVERMISVPNEGRSVETDEPENYYELAYNDFSNSNSHLSFNETICAKKEVIKVTCTDLECGLRPQANKQWSRTNFRGSENISYNASHRHSRIVGGGNAGPGSWPWQAALYREGEFQCGGTLISKNWLISAGHCFYRHQEAYWVARLGILRTTLLLPSPYEQLRQILKIILHPQYVNIGFVNDISLLKMKDPVKFTDYVRPICLPKQEAAIVDGAMCTVVGWGQLSEAGWIFPDTLQEVELPILSSNECRKRTLFLPLYKITDEMFCAGYDRGGRDACLGDSGGPFMCPEADGKWVLIGITSNGYGCARSNRPGVYTRVSKYLNWLESQMILYSESAISNIKSHVE